MSMGRANGLRFSRVVLAKSSPAKQRRAVRLTVEQ